MIDNPWNYVIGQRPMPAGVPLTFNLTVPVPSGNIKNLKIIKICL